MNQFIKLPEARRQMIFNEAAARLNLANVAVEKDFWVCWMLDQLFRLPTWGRNLTFKGGTSLSKGWKLIERFSEDIDIVINREALGFDETNSPETAPSRKQTRKRLDALRIACQECVDKRIKPELANSLSDRIPGELSWELVNDPDDPDLQTLLFMYPSALAESAAYLRRSVKIELGGRSDTEPTERVTIRSYIGEVFPELMTNRDIDVRTVSSKRTFWEKAMLLHEESFRPIGKKSRKKYMARHYYDLYRMIKAGIGDSAAEDEDLFHRIASHRNIYFRYSWVDYSTYAPGRLRLVPDIDQMSDWRQDYNNMKNEMLYGEVPSFEDIMESVSQFEGRFNKGSR